MSDPKIAKGFEQLSIAADAMSQAMWALGRYIEAGGTDLSEIKRMADRASGSSARLASSIRTLGVAVTGERDGRTTPAS